MCIINEMKVLSCKTGHGQKESEGQKKIQRISSGGLIQGNVYRNLLSYNLLKIYILKVTYNTYIYEDRS